MSDRTTSEISGGGGTGDRGARGGKSYYSGGGFDIKSSIFKLSSSTFTSRVNYFGVGDRRGCIIKYKKVPDQSPHAYASGSLHSSQL